MSGHAATKRTNSCCFPWTYGCDARWHDARIAYDEWAPSSARRERHWSSRASDGVWTRDEAEWEVRQMTLRAIAMVWRVRMQENAREAGKRTTAVPIDDGAEKLDDFAAPRPEPLVRKTTSAEHPRHRART